MFDDVAVPDELAGRVELRPDARDLPRIGDDGVLEAGFPGLRRYEHRPGNYLHLLRSLVYFDDAEAEPMPRMLARIDWPHVRQRLESEVRSWAP